MGRNTRHNTPRQKGVWSAEDRVNNEQEFDGVGEETNTSHTGLDVHGVKTGASIENP